MTLYKRIEIDLCAARSHAENATYLTGRQRKSLLRFYTLFEAGRFAEAIALSKRWPKSKDDDGWSLRDMLPEEVWHVLWGIEVMADSYVLKP